jgi:hypothetical protein
MAGWMAAMEAIAKPVLEPMIRGDRTALGPQQQLDVAAWAAMTVVALEQHEPSTTITLPEDRELIAIGFLIVHVGGGHGADLDAIMTEPAPRPDERSWCGLRFPATWSGRPSLLWEMTHWTNSLRRSLLGTTRPAWRSGVR